MSISKSLSNSLMLLLACIGCFVTLVLFYEHLKPNANIGCSAVGGNCEAVNESDYGHVGKVPTSIFGLAMYAAIAAICLKRKKLMATVRASDDYNSDAGSPEVDNDDDNTDIELTAEAGASQAYGDNYPRMSPMRKQLRTLDIAVWLIAAPAIGISWWLQYVSLYKLVSFCPWCMSSAFLVTCLFIFATKDLFLDERPLEGEAKLLVGTVTLMSALGFLMVLPDIMNQVHMAQSKQHANYNGPVVQKITDPPIRTNDMETVGPADAPYTIVEFADYQCPHCQKTSAMITTELRKNPKRYRFAFRNYPLPIHKWATQAALAAEAAGEQGKFWQMHDYLFAHQGDMTKPTFSEDIFSKYAADLGLDVKKFQQDQSGDKIITRVATDTTTARLMKVEMTPTFFVYGRKGKAYQLTGMDKMKLAFNDPDDEAWK